MVNQREGKGWRLALDPGRAPYGVLVGGDGWACELTDQELEALRFGVRRLCEQHGAIAEQLMSEESITIEHEADGLWLELSGDKDHWQLRFVLEGRQEHRGVEAGWSDEAVRALLSALDRPAVC